MEGINERFGKLVAALASSTTDFAKKIGISQSTLYSQLNGSRGLSLDTVIATLTTFPGVSSHWLLTGQGNMYIADNAASISGDESENELDLIAENARLLAEMEDANRRIMVLEDRCKFLKDYTTEVIRATSAPASAPSNDNKEKQPKDKDNDGHAS